MRLLATCLLILPTLALAPATRPTLPQVMADPDWIARSPEHAYFGADSRTVYYDRKRPDSDLRDLYRASATQPVADAVADADLYRADPRFAVPDLANARRLFVRNGDLFLQDLPSGAVRQITSTLDVESDPQWMADESSIQFRRNGNIVVRNLVTGLERSPADVRFDKSPDQKRKDEDESRAKASLAERQDRTLFETLSKADRRAREAEDRALALAKLDPNRVPGPFYLPDRLEAQRASLSPAGDTLLVVAGDRDRSRPTGELMPAYVEADAHITAKPGRPNVGAIPARPIKLYALDLKTETTAELDLAVLPGITEDPLASLKAATRPATHPTSTPAGKPSSRPTTRPVSLREVSWSRDGQHAALEFRSADNKDRWIALYAPGDKALTPLHHEHDEAWTNEGLFTFGFTRDSRSLYFTSEQTGFNHVYLHALATHATLPLTSGPFEVSDVEEAPDGPCLYARANPARPTDYEVIRIPLAGGAHETVTSTHGGLAEFSVSPDGSQLLLTASSPYAPPELFLQPARQRAPGARHDPTQLTRTSSPDYAAIDWVAPRIVAVPTRDGKKVWTKIYVDPASPVPASGVRPVVVFVHGAGYLQNTRSAYPAHYFREQMFNSNLAREGYVVLDPDYRGSAGYGRDWRTEIYRNMGHAELDDVEDAVAYAARTFNADPKHVGIYGGSYGGFLSLMAAFTRGHAFAAAAALRPVADWSHYNHGYTADILNTPDVDPAAYRNSSPIYYAQGLDIPLLICHGLVDNNVFAQDSIRLEQKLIELGKQNFELALYPVESHGFENPSSWLDEYRRIHALFDRHLRAP